METLDRLEECERSLTTPRILYLITRAVRAGAQYHLLDLAFAMQQNFEVAVATGEDDFLSKACRERNISVHILPHLQREIRPIADLRALWEICGLIRGFRPDLIHAHTSKAGFLGRLAGHILGVPSVYTVHGGQFGRPGDSRFWQFIASPCERIAANWGERLITVCREGERLARCCRIGAPSKIVTIHNGIRDSLERAQLNPGHAPVITMVARFCKEKEHDVLLRAFAMLPPGPRLRLIGDGPLRANSEQLAHDLGIYTRVEFLGERDDVPSLLAASDLFALATNVEMLPISILEAMRAGLPVIASRVGGIAELVVDGETGLLVPCGSVSALTEALTSVVENFDLRVKLGRAARRRFEESFLFAHQAECTRSLYLEVLTKGNKAQAEVRGLGAPPSGRTRRIGTVVARRKAQT
jgi:glycosyltransferase involved in cell wall biosynthesis